MRCRVLIVFAVVVLLGPVSWVRADSELHLGVFAYRPPEVLIPRYQPLAEYLGQHLPGVRIRLHVLTQPDIEEALANNQLDLVLTNPSHYLKLRSENSLTGVLATLISLESGQATSSLGGVIVVRADNAGMRGLADLTGRRISIPGSRYLGGYQTQAYEIMQAGLPVPVPADMQTEHSHDQVIRAVLEGRAEAGFVRTGILEQLIREGTLAPGALRVLNPQNLPGFPYQVSTRLYPEWPFVALPQVPDVQVRKIAAALLNLEQEHPAAKAAGIGGFSPPADYLPVEMLARALKVPPYDYEPPITWHGVWEQYRYQIILFLGLAGLVMGLAGLLVLRNRQLGRSLASLNESEQRFRSFFEKNSSVMLLLDPDSGAIVDANPSACGFYGHDLDTLQRMTIHQINTLTPDQIRDEMAQAVREQRNVFNFTHRLADGTLREVEVYSSPVMVEGCPRLFSIIHDITDRKQVERALAVSEQRLKLAIEGVNDGIWDWDLIDNRVIYSPIWKAQMGFAEDELPDAFESFSGRLHPDDAPKVHAMIADYLRGDVPEYRIELRLRHKDGGWRWILARGRALRDETGTPYRMLGSHTDITERKETESALKLAASVFQSAREGIMITDTQGRIVDANEAFSMITGYARDEVLGQPAAMLKSGYQKPEFYAEMWRALRDKGHWYGEIWNRRKNGEVYAELLTISQVRDDAGQARHYVGLFSDITAQKTHELELEHIAHYDALTNLPNRTLFADRLAQAMAHAQRRGQRIALAYIDLDGFKVVNDHHGHKVGDLLLIHIAQRMKDSLREGDTIARLGGDEFVAVLIDLPDIQSSVPLILRLLAATAEPVQVDEMELKVSASIGVTFFPQASEMEADQLLRQADQAMYQAKLAGKNRYHVFDAELDKNVRGHHASLERIRLGLEQGEFRLHYQPKVNMRTGQVLGAEALIRWQHPDNGLLLPAAFLSEIQGHALDVAVGDWVIETALAQVAHWHAGGLAIPVSVNVAAHHLQQPDFVNRLKNHLSRYPELPPGSLQLEVLESNALNDIEYVSGVIRRCAAMGVELALDDFGTGYSSLTYLKRLPANVLKIDQSFVRDMLDDPEDLAILEGVLGLADAFRRQAIAEGVESMAHGRMLLQLGCELAQGYFIAMPMPPEDLPTWLAQWQPPESWRQARALAHEDVPLVHAAVEHRAWVRGMEELLRGARMNGPPLDPEECRFGHWLASLAGQADAPYPGLMERIEPLHRRVHGLGEQLVAHHEAGRRQEAREVLAAMHTARDALLEALFAHLEH